MQQPRTSSSGSPRRSLIKRSRRRWRRRRRDRPCSRPQSGIAAGSRRLTARCRAAAGAEEDSSSAANWVHNPASTEDLVGSAARRGSTVPRGGRHPGLLEYPGQTRFQGFARVSLQQSHGCRSCQEERPLKANQPADRWNPLVLRQVDEAGDSGFATVVVLGFVIRQQLRNNGRLSRNGPIAANRTQEPIRPGNNFHIVVLGGRGEGLDGIETDLAQIGFGLLADKVIGVTQRCSQAVDPFRRWCA